MAKKTVVRSQMSGPAKVMSTSAPGAIMDRNICPAFSKPHDTGNGGIPLKFHEGFGKSEAARAQRGTTATRSAGLTAPSAQGPKNPATRRRG